MVTITLADLEAQFGNVAFAVTDLSPAMAAGAQMYLSEVKDRFNRSVGPDNVPWLPLKQPRPEGGSKPLRNHGLLAASYTSLYTPYSFLVGSNHPAARLQHFGGVVRPVQAKALTIPLSKQAVYAGGPRNMRNLFPVKVRERSYLAERDPKKKTLIFHWLFADAVTIPARPQVGVSVPLLDRIKTMLVGYIRTGRL